MADRDGRFRIAHGGTLLLDEINSLPMTAQSKVLRVLEDGVFQRVGDSESTLVDVRLVCSSNQDLAELVRQGDFREDLFYRIHVLVIDIPPLRERPRDIELLARSFTREFAARLGKTVAGPSADALEVLLAYQWPGNVRELRNVIERAVLLEKGREIRPESLPSLTGLSGETAMPTTLREAMTATERRLLVEALEAAGGVKREAAAKLGIDERNLPYYLKKHGLME